MAMPLPENSEQTVAREDREATGLHVTTSPATTPPPRGELGATMPRFPGVQRPTVREWPGVPAVPGYEVTGEIARGGMGVVLAAQDIELDREVAIKTLLPGVGDAEWAMTRFLDEARITARLQHPGIPPIHQLGTLADGRPFLAMKLIRGRTLATILSAREERIAQSHDGLDLTSLESPGLLHVFEQICHAVGYAHSQGVIHRDLKPANIMVGKFGEVQVMDWGLAKSGVRPQGSGPFHAKQPLAVIHRRPADAKGAATPAGRAMGTPQYMPPEQAKGDWDEVNSRADVFALGGILAAILTGQPPYTGASPVAVLRRAEVGDLDECFARLDASGADAELIALVKRCLSVDPKSRPRNGEDVARQLAAYRLSVEARLMVAEKERARAAAKAEEARIRAAEARLAKRAAEERAVEAEMYADVIAAQAQEQLRRRRGVFIGSLTALLILAGAYGNYRAWQACSQGCGTLPHPGYPCPRASEACTHSDEHRR
jgi:serine/threonine protein kinase